MLTLLLLVWKSRCDDPPTDCEICQNGVDFGYIAYVICGMDIPRGQDMMRSWCKVTYPNDVDRCNTIIVDHWADLVDAYATSFPTDHICPEWGYCPKSGKGARVANTRGRSRIAKIAENPFDALFAYLKGAKTEAEVKGRLEEPPARLAHAARLIPSKDVPLVLMLLQRDAKETFSCYIRERHRSKQ
jgi:hypothetical protein